MTKYREILRLLSLELSQRDIATSLGVSRNTVTKVRDRAKELSLSWPLCRIGVADVSKRFVYEIH